MDAWTVLLVDDMPDNILVARRALEYRGVKVVAATSGAEALALLNTITPTVILLDIRMPTMDGWEVFRALRDNPATCHIPVIALTAYAMESHRRDALAAGFNGYISKPFNVPSLFDDIQRVIEARS